MNEIYSFLIFIHQNAYRYIESVSVPAEKYYYFMKKINKFNINAYEMLDTPKDKKYDEFMGYKLLISDDNNFHINYKTEYVLDIAAMGGCADKYWKKATGEIKND